MIKQLLQKSEFTKNTFILVIGTVAAQSIPLLLHPFLRRIYSPEDFGAMAVYLNIFGMLTIVSALRYEATIVLPKNNNEAANILSLAFIVNIAFSTLLLLAILFFKEDLCALLNFPLRYSNYLYFLPLACSVFGIYQSMNYWLIRNKAFKASTNNKIIRRLVEGSIQTSLGLLKIPGGLFVGDLAGNVANMLSGLRQIFKNAYSFKWISAKKLRYVFQKYIDYPKYNVLPTLFSSIASMLPFLIINKYYSTETVGYLDLSRLVLSIPLVFISATISQVFFQQTTAKRHNSQSIKRDIRNILLLLFVIIFAEAVVIFLAGPILFSLVFGEKYGLSGFYSQILIFSFALNFITSTFSSVFMTFEKIRINSIWQVAYLLAICSLFLFTHLNINDFLKMYVCVEVVMQSINCLLIYFIVNKYEQEIKREKNL